MLTAPLRSSVPVWSQTDLLLVSTLADAFATQETLQSCSICAAFISLAVGLAAALSMYPTVYLSNHIWYDTELQRTKVREVKVPASLECGLMQH